MLIIYNKRISSYLQKEINPETKGYCLHWTTDPLKAFKYNCKGEATKDVHLWGLLPNNYEILEEGEENQND